MRTRGSLAFAAVAAVAAARNISIPVSPVPSNPGGALLKNTKGPSTAGFDALQDPSVLPSRGREAVCVTGLVPVHASATNVLFDFHVPDNQTQVTETFIELFTAGSPFSKQIMDGTHSVSGAYNTSATLCTPGDNLTPSVVQILTHGVGFDKSYWDFAPGYSYADLAASNGYVTFFYDRLGVGASTVPSDGINVVQAPLEVSILHSLIGDLRLGKFSNITPSKIVGAGHAFGSILTQAITAKYPSDLGKHSSSCASMTVVDAMLADAAILTGYSTNTDGMAAFTLALNLQIASQADPFRFSNFKNSYLLTASASSDQIGFLRAPGFDSRILPVVEATKGSVTFGELFSTSAVGGAATNYTKPVAVVNGANDLPFCFGNCSYPTNLAQAVFPALYPAVESKTPERIWHRRPVTDLTSIIQRWRLTLGSSILSVRMCELHKFQDPGARIVLDVKAALV
nr:hypothetical protein CFP56_02576 [Quercus suber]